jgi:hypothetical protein
MSTKESSGLLLNSSNGMNHVDAAPHWVVRLLAVCCLGLIPWTIGLAVTLPRSYLVANWPLAWTGFDVILLGCLATTAWTLHKRRHAAVQASMTTSALLFCDAWFDVLTAHGGLCRTVSVATAMFAEIPLALMLSLISVRLLRESVAAGLSLEINAAQVSIRRTPLPIQPGSPAWLMRAALHDTRSSTHIKRTHRVSRSNLRDSGNVRKSDSLLR